MKALEVLHLSSDLPRILRCMPDGSDAIHVVTSGVMTKHGLRCGLRHPCLASLRTTEMSDASNGGICNLDGGSDTMICHPIIHRSLGATAISLLIAIPGDEVAAGEIAFSDWTHQRFSLLGGNTWRQQGSELSVESDGAVSLLWQAVPEGLRQVQTATWTWSVEQGVPPTDLTQRGGDDRNLSLYAIFAPAESVATAERQGIRSLLDNPDVRVLMYVWGGAHARGDLLPSPYIGARGKTIVLRPAEIGQHDEQVDLRADLERAFGVTDLALVGLAVSADSDDTGTTIRARVRMLQLS